MATSSDELMLMLGELPRDSVVRLFMPTLDADAVVAEAARRSGARWLEREDAHTVRFHVASDTMFVPVPGEQAANLAGLLTVTLPPGIVRGQEFRVVVHQLSREPRQVVGTFEVLVPVTTANELIASDVRRYSVLRHILAAVPASDRWHPVLDANIRQLGERLAGFGVDPTRIKASPDGDGLQSWPLFRYGRLRQGRSPFVGPRSEACLWTCDLRAPVLASPTVAAHGVVYVGSTDHRLYAVRPDGSVAWRFQTHGPILSSAAIGSDGTIYVGSEDARLYAIHPDGTLKWSFLTGGPVRSSPAIAPDGTIYVGSDDNRLYAINPNGTKRWHHLTGADVWSSPAIANDGTVYVGSDDNHLHALDASGAAKWHFRTFADVKSTPAIGADGTLYVGSEDNHLYAIAADGTERWRFDARRDIKSSPALAADGTIYVGSDRNRLIALSAAGKKTWEFVAQGDVGSSPSVASDGTIYFGAEDHRIYALRSDGTLLWSQRTGGSVSSSVAIASGVIYVGSHDGKLYAFGEG